MNNHVQIYNRNVYYHHVLSLRAALILHICWISVQMWKRQPKMLELDSDCVQHKTHVQSSLIKQSVIVSQAKCTNLLSRTGSMALQLLGTSPFPFTASPSILCLEDRQC